MTRMPESTARLVFPLDGDFLGVALDSTRFYLRRYRVGRQPSLWVRRVLEKALAAPARKGPEAAPRARLDLRASKSSLRLTLRVPASRAGARLQALLNASVPGAAGRIRSRRQAALVILTVSIPEDR